MEHVVKQKQLPVLDLDFVKQKKVSSGGAFHLIFPSRSLLGWIPSLLLLLFV